MYSQELMTERGEEEHIAGEALMSLNVRGIPEGKSGGEGGLS